MKTASKLFLVRLLGVVVDQVMLTIIRKKRRPEIRVRNMVVPRSA